MTNISRCFSRVATGVSLIGDIIKANQCLVLAVGVGLKVVCGKLKYSNLTSFPELFC